MTAGSILVRGTRTTSGDHSCTGARPSDFIELTKPRIVLMVIVTVAAGFWMADPAAAQALAMFHVLIGTAMVAGGTNALNQVAERDIDRLMRRTRERPLPAGRLGPGRARAFAWGMGLGGIAYLWVFVGALVSALAAATLASYVFLYTPLKRHSTAATLIGAVPGALPIAGGWAAVTGDLSLGAWVLFWILFLWQLPHFLALGWMYRADYARAGLRMAGVGDSDGHRTFGFASLYAAALLPVSLLPTMLGMTGSIYFFGALLLSAAFLAVNASAARRPSGAAARRAFRTSLVYLPVLLVLMVGSRGF
jgi:protoheme IX farnesyltransferase